MSNAPIGNQVTVIRPKSYEKLVFLVKVTRTRADGEELRDIERAIADLLSDRYEEAVASATVPEALNTLTRPVNDTGIMTYRDGQERVQITISGLSLPATAESPEAFLRPISENVVALLHEKKVGPADASEDVCVCAVTGIPGRVFDLQEVRDYMTANPPQEGRWRFILLFGDRSDDAIGIEVPEAITLPLNETEIGLGNRTDWDKEITAWTYCKDRTITIHQRASLAEPSFIRLRAAECYSGDADTIIFRKQKFLGVWTDMYSWDSNGFWEFHGGRRITYMWCWHGDRSKWSCNEWLE